FHCPDHGVEDYGNRLARKDIAAGTLLKLHDLYTSLPHAVAAKCLLLRAKKHVETKTILLVAGPAFKLKQENPARRLSSRDGKSRGRWSSWLRSRQGNLREIQ